jgi:PAS domain-containing protein
MTIDRTKVSFAEAEGRFRFPGALKWGEVDQRLRSALWTPFYFFLSKATFFDPNRGHQLREPAFELFINEYLCRRHSFISDFQQSRFRSDSYIKEWEPVFKQGDWIELFDFITFIVRDGNCPRELIEDIVAALDEPYSPYRLDINSLTIIPVISEIQAETLKSDLGRVFETPFAGAKTHLQAALDALNQGDHRAVVRESINAVESAVRDFTNDPNAILSRALRKLVDEQGMHRALSDAFEKLYAYTSDENGIRHALVFGDNEKVGFDEAIFFVSACSAFVAFLGQKAKTCG